MKERGNRFFRFLDRRVGAPLLQLSGPRSPKTPVNIGDARKVGVLCLGAIGDLLLSSALLEGIAANLPQASIEIIASWSNRPALDLLDDSYRKSAFPVSAPVKLLRHIRKSRYDALIDTTQWARLGALLSRWSGAKLAVGFDTPGQCRGGAYHLKVRHRADVHESENFAALGKALFKEFAYQPRLVLPSDFTNPFADASIIVLHLWPARGLGRHLKTWPQAAWAELAGKLLAQGFTLLLTGSRADEKETGEFIDKHFSAEKNVINGAGKFTLPQLAVILTQARALVSVNTGIMHLGAILGAPTVGLHGATNPMRWGPRGPKTISLAPKKGESGYLNLGFEYPPDAMPAMQWIEVDEVLGALHELLFGNGSSSS